MSFVCSKTFPGRVAPSDPFTQCVRPSNCLSLLFLPVPKKAVTVSNVLNWRDFDAAELEKQVSPSSRIGGDWSAWAARYASESAKARATIAHRELITQGGFVFFFAGPHPFSPVLVFIHGGYWQALSGRDSCFLAPHAHAAGLAFAAVEYPLAPEASIADQVDACTKAVLHIRLCADELAIDPFALSLAGHSAGAHLALHVALREPGEFGLTFPLVRNLILVSGVYDLAPLVSTSVNDALNLTPNDAAALSAHAALSRAGSEMSVPMTAAVAENDTDLFVAQQNEFVVAARAAGHPITAMTVGNTNHFDLPFHLLDPQKVLGATVLRQLGCVDW